MTTIDITKVLFARFHWVNQHNEELDKHPPDGVRTDHAKIIPKEFLAKKLQLGYVDEWRPRIVFTFPATQTVTFYDERALKLWELWNAHVYSKQAKLVKKLKQKHYEQQHPTTGTVIDDSSEDTRGKTKAS